MLRHGRSARFFCQNWIKARLFARNRVLFEISTIHYVRRGGQRTARNCERRNPEVKASWDAPQPTKASTNQGTGSTILSETRPDQQLSSHRFRLNGATHETARKAEMPANFHREILKCDMACGIDGPSLNRVQQQVI